MLATNTGVTMSVIFPAVVIGALSLAVFLLLAYIIVK